CRGRRRGRVGNPSYDHSLRSILRPRPLVGWRAVLGTALGAAFAKLLQLLLLLVRQDLAQLRIDVLLEVGQRLPLRLGHLQFVLQEIGQDHSRPRRATALSFAREAAEVRRPLALVWPTLAALALVGRPLSLVRTLAALARPLASALHRFLLVQRQQFF